jgi:hypothetical protein
MNNIFDNTVTKTENRPPPPIFITSADNQQQQQQQGNFYLNMNEQQQASAPSSPLSAASSPRFNPQQPQLTVQTQNLNQQQQLNIYPQQQQPGSPSLTPTFQTAINTPLPPSPCATNPNQFLSEDPHSVYHNNNSNSNNHNNHNHNSSERSPMLTQQYMMDPRQPQFNTTFHP